MKDLFRKKPIELSDEDRCLIAEIKNAAEILYSKIEAVNSREGSLAKTKLEECVMWAIKGVTAKYYE